MNIPQPRFLLRDPKGTTPTLISCHLRFTNERIVFSIGEKIIPIEWDFSKQRAINSKKYPHNSELNVWIDKIDTDLKSLFRTYNLEKITPSTEMIKDGISNSILNKVESKIPSLLKFIDSYIVECKKIKNPSTVKTYITTYTHLKSYAKLHNSNLDYSSITLDFYNSFLNYMMHNLNLSQNTIGKHIQVFKTFLNEATDRGYNKKLEFRGRKFKRLTEPVESIYLNIEELDIIRRLDLKDKPSLERVRDLFLIGCYTGGKNGQIDHPIAN